MQRSMRVESCVQYAATCSPELLVALKKFADPFDSG